MYPAPSARNISANNGLRPPAVVVPEEETNATIVPFSIDPFNDSDIAAVRRECPKSRCPQSFTCPHESGTCCGDGKSCCPKGATCLTTNPPTCVIDDINDRFRCALEECRVGHQCPYGRVAFCCVGGDVCCPEGYECAGTNPPTCRLMTNPIDIAKQKKQYDDYEKSQLATDEVAKAREGIQKEERKKAQDRIDAAAKQKINAKEEELKSEAAEKREEREASLPAAIRDMNAADRKRLTDGIVFELGESNAMQYATSKKGGQRLMRSGGGFFIDGAFEIPSATAPAALASDFPAPLVYNSGTDDFSVSGWFMTGLSSGSPVVMVSKKFPGRGAQPGWAVGVEGGRVFFSLASMNNVTTLRSPSDSRRFNDSRWHHFAALRDNTVRKMLVLYVDGRMLDFAVEKEPFSVNTRASFRIGAWFDTTPPAETFVGLLQEIQLAHRAFSDSEVSDAFRSVSINEENERIFLALELRRARFAEAGRQLAALSRSSPDIAARVVNEQAARKAEQDALSAAAEAARAGASAKLQLDKVKQDQQAASQQSLLTSDPNRRLQILQQASALSNQEKQLEREVTRQNDRARSQMHRAWTLNQDTLRAELEVFRAQVTLVDSRAANGTGSTVQDQSRIQRQLLDRKMAVGTAALRAVRSHFWQLACERIVIHVLLLFCAMLGWTAHPGTLGR